jgi:HemY protein
MKKLLFYFIILLAAVWVGLKIAADPGYLLIAYQKNTVEMPLWLAVIGVLCVFFILYFLFRILSNLRAMGERIQAWSRTRRLRRAFARTQRGLLLLAAGEWKQAEKDLIRAAPRMDMPILNYLASAYAAQAQEAIAKRDEYLGKIEVKNKTSALALGLVQAHLQLRQRQYEQALATLQQLQQIAPKHPAVLKLLNQTYLLLEDWGTLEILFPQLEKHAVLKEDTLEKLHINIYEGLLKTAGNDGISLVWARVPKKLRYFPALLNIYIPPLVLKDPDEAEILLRTALQKNLDTQLLIYYGLIKSTQLEKQLQTAEGWLKTYPKNAALLLTLGRLCVKAQLWGKARSYFETSLSIAAWPETCQALGELSEHLGETPQAILCYKKGLALKSALISF